MSNNDIQRLLSLFQINILVVQEYLNVNSLYIEQIVNCDTASDLKKIRKTDICRDWDNLKVRLYNYFAAAQISIGKPISKHIQQTYEDLLIQYHIFYEGIIEFQTCQMLNQYLQVRGRIQRGEQSKAEFRQLINLLIWKTNQLHFIIRIIIGYIAYVRIGKQIGNIDRVFQQISKLIEKSLKNGSSYQQSLFRQDIELFSNYWNKIIQASGNETDAVMLISMIQTAQFYFSDYKFLQQLIQQLQNVQQSKISLLSQSQETSNKKKPVLQTNNLMPQEYRSKKTIDLGKIVKTEQTQASTSKRIKTTSSIKKVTTSQYQNIEEDPIFQIQVENYHINQIVKRGCFKIKKPVTLSTCTQRYKTQPSMKEEMMPLLTFQDFEPPQDSILELPSPVKAPTESEPKQNGKDLSITHSQSSQSKIDKITSYSNPYRLKNLISSRFQQILDIAQLSAQSTPKHSEQVKSIRRQKTISIRKEQKELQLIPAISPLPAQEQETHQLTSERRRSGVVVSHPDAASQISQAIQQSSQQDTIIPVGSTQQIQLAQSNSQTLIKRPQRRNVLILKTATTFYIEQTSAYIPRFKFSLCYSWHSVFWEVSLQMNLKNDVLLSFCDTSHRKLVYRTELNGLQFESIKDWHQVIEAFIGKFQQQANSCLPYLNYNKQLSLRNHDNYNFIKSKGYQFELGTDQIVQMGLMKDLFRWMYTTYLYEQINITGIKLRLCQNEKDKTLNAYRELLNVIQLYRRMILQSHISDEKSKTNLLINSYGGKKYIYLECIKNNISLLNRILNLRINNQKEKKFMIHKQFVNFKKLSISNDDESVFFIIKVSIVLQKEGILYYKKNDYRVRPQVDVLFEAIDSPIDIKPLRLQFYAIEKILEKNYYTDLKQIVNQIFFQQRRFLRMFYDFIEHKLMINEQKQLQVRMNIFSLHDAQKMEACGMKLGFLIDLKTKVKPFAITEIERYIYDDTQKKLDIKQKSNTIHQREHMFDKHFGQIFGDDGSTNEQQHFMQTTLIDLVKRYQPNQHEVKEEVNKVGQIIIYQENPFTDIHVDDLEKIKSQFFKRSPIKMKMKYKYRKGLKYITLSMHSTQITLSFHYNQRFHKYSVSPQDDEDNIINNTLQFIQNGPACWISQMIFQRLTQRVLKSSFMGSQLSDGLELLKYKKSKSQLAEIPSYTVLHYYILNNFMVLLKYFTLKQFVMVQKIKKYGKFQITIKVFFRCQKPDILTDGDYFLMRIDFQNILLKTGMMKMIFNKYDITEILKIDIPQTMTDANIVATAMNIFYKCHLGTFTLSIIPFFSMNSLVDQNDTQLTQNSYEDHSTKINVSRIRRISNFPENTTFKKSDLCKGFLEHYIKNSRLIITHVKKCFLISQLSSGQLLKISNTKISQLMADQVQTSEYVLIQIYRHLLLDIWIMKIYVPKTTRQMVGIMVPEDFKENDNLMDSMTIYRKGSIHDLDIFMDMTPRPSVSQMQRSTHRFSAPKISQMQSLQASAIYHLGQSQILPYYLSDFFNLTKTVTDFTEYHLETANKEPFVVKEKLIWMNLINNNFTFEIHPKQDNCFLQLNFNTREICLQELLFQRYIRIERVGESHIEFYMKYTKKNDQLKGLALLKGRINQMQQQHNKFPGIISEIKFNEEQIRFMKRTCIFFSFEAISYANTSTFNIELKYFSYNKFTEVKEQINLRELLNLYIADGFYKYQTNYMNSKLNHSDILSICFYMIHKIKTQNFLNLSQYHTIPNLSQLKQHKVSNKVEKPVRQSIHLFRKPYIFNISLLYNEVQITSSHWKSCHQTNEIFSYSHLSTLIPYFQFLAEQYPQLAMHRIISVLDKLMHYIQLK